MKLERNLTAPLFRVKDIYGRIIDLNDYKEKRVFIGFFRHAGCPFCNIRVHSLTKVYEELKVRGLEMIFFFESKEKVFLIAFFIMKYLQYPLSQILRKDIMNHMD
jgi:peroxiredoxin